QKKHFARAIFFYASYNKPERLCKKYKPLIENAIQKWDLSEETYLKDLLQYGGIKYTDVCK
ncbi:MAG: hypothetical protein ACPG4Y_09455, partial [Chitinophagales bacterium]